MMTEHSFLGVYLFNCVLLGFSACQSLSTLSFELYRYHLTILTNRTCGTSVDKKTGNGFMFGLRVKQPNISYHVTQSDLSSTLKWGKVCLIFPL